jgi:ribosomal protein L9
VGGWVGLFVTNRITFLLFSTAGPTDNINSYIKNYLQKRKDSEALNSGLKKQLETKAQVSKNDNEKQKELQTIIDDLIKTEEMLNPKVQLVSTVKVEGFIPG